jgi:hypothetical protein
MQKTRMCRRSPKRIGPSDNEPIEVKARSDMGLQAP